MSRKACYAHQYSDQMHCHKCGLVWDMDDPDPPQCIVTVKRRVVVKKGTSVGKSESLGDIVQPEINKQ